MLIIVFLFLLGVTFGEIFGLMNPLYRYLTSAVVFLCFIYQYQRTRQFGKERLLTREELTRTNEIIQTLIATTNINKLLSLIMDNLMRGERFESAFIYQKENDDTFTCIAIKGAVALEGIKRFTFKLEDHDKIIGRTVRTRTLVTVQDVESNHLVDKEIKELLQLRQFILLPLVIQDKTSGLIIIGNSNDRITFTAKDIAISNTIANQAAVALQNAWLYSKIQELSVVDELTQSYNHRFFQQKIREEIELARRYDSNLSLAMIDVDFFKNYNDKNGHLAGDICLKQAVQVILASLRKTDIVSRYGGDEFALILSATDKLGAAKILEKIRVDIEKYPFEFKHNQPDGKVTISTGIAAFPQDAKESRELIDLADQSLYQAKKLGRNRITICETAVKTNIQK